MKTLAIDPDQLMALMESAASPEVETYLDLETGRPVSLSRKVLRAVDGDDHRALNHLEAKLRPEIRLAADVMFNCTERYAPIPLVSPSDMLRYMRAFAKQMQDPDLREALMGALEGRGGSRRFRVMLAGRPSVLDDWRDFKRAAVFEKVSRWLGELDIEPVSAARMRH